ncbi:conjugative transposon protein TraJ [Mucilaginibacter sp. RCC_168]|uniref:conjugative transposon protein TraJ n=1 Tax=Mucilaginibacter sp. RCC_168 TaxID=3239221 RepID=UPI0035258CC9
MYRSILTAAFFAVLAMLLPNNLFAEGIADTIGGMQPVLDNVYNEMIPLCGKLIGVAQGLAGFGALWYIASRVWRQIANAEPIDFYPLLRPFALGLAIIAFQKLVIPVMNGILQPVVTATGAIVSGSNDAVMALLKKKDEAVKNSEQWKMYVGETGSGDANKWYKYTHPKDPNREDESMFEGIGNDIKFWADKNYYNFRNSIKEWLSEVLQVLFAAAALCINTIRTFYLIVLAILGPLVFGFAVYDGFQQTLSVWLARYVNVFMWLPVANIFSAILGKIQENMLKIDISQIGQQGDTFFSVNDSAYMIFMVIGIVGYFTVPNVANYIVHAGGGNALLQKVTSIVSGATSAAAQYSKAGGLAAGGQMARGVSNILHAPFDVVDGYNTAGKSGGSDYQHDKLASK